MASNRAKWCLRYEKGLVDILTEYKHSHYRGQNGWNTEGWNKISRDFNAQFPQARFTRNQIQDKEGQFKKDYKVIKTILKRSGVSWKNSMVNTTAAIWEELLEEDPKLSRYENRSFPLFEAWDELYQGQFAEGKLVFTSSQPPRARSKSLDAGARDKVLLDFSKKRPWCAAIEVGADDGDDLDHAGRVDEFELHALQGESLPGLEEEKAMHKGKDRRPRQRTRGKSLCTEHHQGPQDEPDDSDQDDESYAPKESDELAPTRSVAAGGGSNRGRSRKFVATKPVPRIEETMSEFLALKKIQSAAKMRSKTAGDEYSITRCLAVLEETDDVSDEIRIHASDVFKDAANREIFLGYEPRLRGLWLKKEVNKLGVQFNLQDP